MCVRVSEVLMKVCVCVRVSEVLMKVCVCVRVSEVLMKVHVCVCMWYVRACGRMSQIFTEHGFVDLTLDLTGKFVLARDATCSHASKFILQKVF